MKMKLPTLLLLTLIVAAACIVGMPHASWSSQDRMQLLSAPSILHPAGTDAIGRDQLVRISGACLLSFVGAAAAALVTTTAAAVIGSWIGLAPAYLKMVALLVCDAVLCLPLLFLFMLVRSTLPLNLDPWKSASVTYILFCLIGWPAGARLLATRATEANKSLWMLQAQAAGVSNGRILARFVVPYLRPLLVAEFFTMLPLIIMAEANLGLLGLGVGEPLPSWGGLLHQMDNSAMFAASSWTILPMVVLVVLLGILQLISLQKENA